MECAELLCNVTNTGYVVVLLTGAGVCATLSLLNFLMPVGSWHGDSDFGECVKLH